ncbi:class I SAM-dependent methyltransferase [bacterium]|nr:class I SAM-dependent methyltransferase [bacterium]
MDRLRKILKSILPGWWWDRIDLENSSIRYHVMQAASEAQSNELVLDAGAGQCRYRSCFDHTKYIGVDFGRGEGEWDYSVLDTLAHLEQLPFADATFDRIIFTQVLEHVAEPEIILQELYRVLKFDGRMLLTAPLGFGEHQEPYDYFRYTRYGLRHLLEKVGFTVDRLEPRGGYFRYMAVMMMWFYIYLFPENRSRWLKILLSPLQYVAAIKLIVLGPPLIQSLDFLDKEKKITLGFAVNCSKEFNER